MTKKNSYSFLTGLEKTFFKTIVVALPIVADTMPEEWMNITLGAVLVFIVNFAKNWNKEEVQDTSSQG